MLAAAAVVLVGCTASTGGSPESPARVATTAPSATSSAGGTDAPTAASTGAPTTAASSAGAEPAPLCPDAGTSEAITSCLADAIATFWSGQLNDAVSEPVVLHPAAAQVPVPCRPGLTIAPAFTCPGNSTLYVTDDFLASLESTFPGALRSYAFAVVQAHEMGHIVQLHVHQPQIEQDDREPAVTRFVEQQADCLSGVWAHAATASLGLDAAEFRAVALEVLQSISTPREVETHGTPEERIAAIDRGLQGGRPQSCQLATFH